MILRRRHGPVMPRHALSATLALLAPLTAPTMAAAQEVVLTLPEGEADALRPALESASLILDLSRGGTDPVAQDYVAAARADYRRLLTALYGEGHYGPTISILLDGREAAGIAPLDAPSRIQRIELRIDPGPPFTFGTASVTPLTPATSLPEGFARGEPARADLIRSAVSAGIAGWRDEGHARASATTESVTAIHPERRLDAAVTLDPGPQLTFGPLTVTGNQAVRTERIIAIAGLRQDHIFSPAELEAAANRLRRTGAFSAVALIEGDGPLQGFALPIEAQVTEALPRRLGAGAELSSTEGLRLSAYWMHRNFLGGAERFRVEGEIDDIGGGSGGIDYRIGLSYGRPATLRADTDLAARLDLRHLDEETYRLDQLSGEVTLRREVLSDLVVEGGPGFVTARERTGFRTRDYTLLTFPLRATLDRRDDPLDARAGYFVSLDTTPFLGVAGGSDGARLYGDARLYRSFGTEDRVTLAARTQFGALFTDDILDAPADFLFYSGGGGTVRGQPYRSLGLDLTRDFGLGDQTVRTGGASFLGAQVEGRVRLGNSFGLVGFYDWGYVDNESLPTGEGDWHAGAGIGIRYDTGIGPIRLDIATPVTGRDAYEDIEIYIGIGQSF